MSWLSVEHAAKYLDTTESAVRSLIARGKLRAYRRGDRRVNIRISDLEEFATQGGTVVGEHGPQGRGRQARTKVRANYDAVAMLRARIQKRGSNGAGGNH